MGHFGPKRGHLGSYTPILGGKREVGWGGDTRLHPHVSVTPSPSLGTSPTNARIAPGCDDVPVNYLMTCFCLIFIPLSSQGTTLSWLTRRIIMRSLASTSDILSKAAATNPTGVKGPTVVESREQKDAEMAAVVSQHLPKTVPTIYGELSYADFKSRFSTVYEQIQDKSHLLTGKVSCSFSIGSTSVTIRSLRTRERLALAPLAGSIDNQVSGDPRYRTYLLVLAIEKLDSMVFPSVRLTPDTLDEWRKNEQVKLAVDTVENLDESFFLFIFGLFTDLNAAKNLALIENLKNPT